MGQDLFGKQVLNTYDAIIKVGDNDTLTGIAKQLSDGRGNDAPIWLSTARMGIGITPDTNYTLTVNGAAKIGSLDVTGAVTAASVRLTGGSGSQGLMTWNTDEETVDIVQNGATLQVGQEVQVHVKNQTGALIPDGTPVYVTGTLGSSGRLTVAPMIADGSIEAKYFLGITTEDIGNGEDGKVTTFGKIRGLNTSAYAEGTTLYVSASTAGAFQTTAPVAPNLDLEVAIVINSHVNNGTIFVRAQQGYYLGLLHDVYLNSPANNQFLVYNSTTSRWENQGISSVGSINLDTVTDNGNTTTNNINVGDITAGNMTLSGYLRGAANFVIDPAAYGDETGVVQILGDLRVDGTTTTINSTTVTINDKNIVLASGSATAADANGAGITIDGAAATMLYNSTSDRFVFNKDIQTNLVGNVTGNVTGNLTGDVTGNLTGDVTGNLTGNVTGNLTGNVTGDLTGNADTASALATARNIAVDGAVTGNADFDGSANITITTTVNHNHDDRYYTEAESDNRFVNVDGDTMTDDLNFDSGSKVRLHSGSFADANDRYEIFATGDVMFLQYWDNDQGNGTSLQKVILSIDGTGSQREATLFGDLRLKSGNVASPTYDAVVLDLDTVNGHVDIINVRNGSFSGDLTATTNLIVGTTNVYDNLPTGALSFTTTDNRLKFGVVTNQGNNTNSAIDDIVLAESMDADYIPYVSSAGGNGDTVNAVLSQSWLKQNSDTLEIGNVSDPFSVDSKIIKVSRQIAPNEKQITEFKAQGIFVTSTTATYGTKNSRLQFNTNGRLNVNNAYTLPEGDGTSGQVLSTNGSGDLSWVAAGGPTTSDLQDVTDNGATTTNDISTGRITIANNVSTGGFTSFDDYQLILYKDTTASTSYGLGIESGTLMFHSNDKYRFYVNNSIKATISSAGDISATSFTGSGSSLTGVIKSDTDNQVLGRQITLGDRTSLGTYNPNLTGLTLTSVAEVRTSAVDNPPALAWHYEGQKTRHILLDATGNLNVVAPSDENGGIAVLQVNSEKVATENWVNANTLNETEGDARYVNVTGDTMTGLLNANSGVKAGTGGVTAWGNLIIDTSLAAGWGTTQQFPYIGSTGGTVGSLVMIHNPHVPFRTDNKAEAGYDGRAGLRLARNAAGDWWDVGLAGDFFHIYRNGSGELLRLNNSGVLDFGGNSVETTVNDKLAIGQNTSYAWIQSYGGRPLYLNNLGNNVILANTTTRLGVGTSSPTLSPSASISGIESRNSSYIQLRVSSSASSAGIEFIPHNTGSTHNYEVQASSAGDWFVYDRTVGGTDGFRFLVEPSGDVVIGNTSANFGAANRRVLEINGTSEALLSMSTGGSWQYYIHALSSGIYHATGNKNLLLEVGSGGVGIGTTSPQSKLHIGSGSSPIYLDGVNLTNGNGYYSVSNGTKHIFMGVDNSDYGIVGTFTNHPLGFRTNNTERTRITAGGTLLHGGTATPGESVWLGTGVFGKDGYDKVIMGSLTSSTNGAIIGGHNSALNAWAPLAINGTELRFNYNETRVMTMTSGGLFINTGVLGVNRTGVVGSKIHAEGYITGGTTGSVGLPNRTSMSNVIGFEARSTSGGGEPSICFHKEGIYTMYIEGRNSGRGVVVTSAGGETAANFYCQGDIVAYYSDMRLKTKIGDIQDPIGKLQALNGFYYEPNEIAQSYGYEKERRIGLSAQEVKEVVPEAVSDATIGDGYMSVDYAKLVPVLVEAIKEQQKQIDELKARLDGSTD